MPVLNMQQQREDLLFLSQPHEVEHSLSTIHPVKQPISSSQDSLDKFHDARKPKQLKRPLEKLGKQPSLLGQESQAKKLKTKQNLVDLSASSVSRDKLRGFSSSGLLASYGAENKVAESFLAGKTVSVAKQIRSNKKTSSIGQKQLIQTIKKHPLLTREQKTKLVDVVLTAALSPSKNVSSQFNRIYAYLIAEQNRYYFRLKQRQDAGN